MLEPGVDRAGQGGEGRLDEALDFAGGGESVLFGVVEITARLGIGVGPAADDRQCGRAGELPLDFVAGVAGPLGADLIELAAQGCAMASVAEENGPDFTGRVGGPEDGQADGRPARWD